MGRDDGFDMGNVEEAQEAEEAKTWMWLRSQTAAVMTTTATTMMVAMTRVVIHRCDKL